MLDPVIRDLVWGKSEYQVPGSRRWLPLVTHLYDSAAVGERVWDVMLSRNVRQTIATAGGMSLNQARRVFVFLCGTHDVGKASNAFVYKSPWLHQRIKDAETVLGNCPRPSRDTRHETVSHVSLTEWLYEMSSESDVPDRLRFRRAAGWSVPVGGHHGVMPQHSGKRVRNSTIFDSEDSAWGVFSDSAHWYNVRKSLISEMAEHCGISQDDVFHMAHVPLADYGQNLLTAAVITADWIASDASLFAYGENLEDVVRPSAKRADQALTAFGFSNEWSPISIVPQNFSESFKSKFGFTPSPSQTSAAKHINQHMVAGEAMFLLVEDSTGSGKTETGLLAAETLAANVGARGVMVALPTKATSNAMFTRVRSWMGTFDNGYYTTKLAHSAAALNPDQSTIPRVGMGTAASSIHCAESRAVVHRWMAGRHRSLFSDFTVGVIDNVLGVSLNRDYVLLPHLALAAKVVVLDEVHDSDVYMREFLFRALEWFGRYNVPVIALSATLTPSFRRQLHAAYTGQDVESVTLKELSTESYPLITSSSPAGTCAVTRPPTLTRRKSIELETTPETGSAPLVEELRKRSRHGGCLSVVVNTVKRAQETYTHAVKEFPDWKVLLLHSRFTLKDRVDRERELIALLGKEGNRPEKLIVIGTQVLEQSLDIDADMLITELAPSDVLFQRAGRLHRHNRPGRNTAHTTPVMVITGVPCSESAPVLDPSSKAVYGAARMLSAAAAVNERKRIVTPDDVVKMVRDPQSVTEVPAAWESAFSAAVAEYRGREAQLRQLPQGALVPRPERIMNGPHPGWNVDSSVNEHNVRNSIMDRTALVLTRDSDGNLIMGKTVVMSFDGITRENLPRGLVRELSAQEVSIPKSVTAALPTIGDLVGDGYVPRWDVETSYLVDLTVMVLVVESGECGETRRIRYDPGQGLLW